MTLWIAIFVGSALVYSWKIIGYLVPERFLSHPRIKELAGLLTVALMAALVGVQTFGSNEGIALDARIPAILVAGVLFWFRVPYVIVVLAAALIAAGIRLIF
jgi:hypothetical protein